MGEVNLEFKWRLGNEWGWPCVVQEMGMEGGLS